MSTISSAGIGSGLDVNAIITQLLAIERQPIDALKVKSRQIDTQLSEFGKLKGLISTFRDAALKLTRDETWSLATGTSSDATAVGVAVRSGAALGSYSLEVQSLAASQTLASGVFAGSTATPGAGTLRIELGAWDSGSAFTPKSGATAVDITVTATDTLTDVRDKINAAGAGVTATIFTDASGSRLLMRSSTTGAQNGFRTTVTDGDGNPADAAGLSALAYDPSASIAQMTRTETAADAAATLNGLAVASASNTLTDIVDGVTLTLGKVTTAPVEVKVVQDSAGMKTAVQDFADAYNALNTLLASELKYDAASKTGGPLQGDSTAVAMQRQLRTMMGTSSGASTLFSRLSDVGLAVQRDGSIAVTATKLDTALADVAEMKKLFANVDAGVPANNGLARQFRLLGDAMLGVDGPISSRTEGLTMRKDFNADQQERLETRVAMTEKRLRAQYTALDEMMGKLTGLSAYVTQQMAMFNNSSKS